ncbi:MAG: NAD(P)H-hydrate epimerase [Paracoccaceae bacterium]
MDDVITEAQMREIERKAIHSGAFSGLDLMERAGQCVVDAILDQRPELAAYSGASSHHSDRTPRAAVLCGPGNNGGDGYVVARLLRALGWTVEVLALGDPSRLPDDAAQNYKRWCKIGPVVPLTLQALKRGSDADIFIDAVLGIGLSRPVTGDLGDVLRHLAGYGGDRDFYQPRLVAVDVPSGLGADTGLIPGKGTLQGALACPFCALTVTFHKRKIGHVSGDGPMYCGHVVVADIGL